MEFQPRSGISKVLDTAPIDYHFILVPPKFYRWQVEKLPKKDNWKNTNEIYWKREQNVRKHYSNINKLLKYNGITPFGDQLLLGKALDLPSLHNQAKIILKQLREINGRLPPLSTPITQQ